MKIPKNVGLDKRIHTRISNLQQDMITARHGAFVSKPSIIRFLLERWEEYEKTLKPKQIRRKMVKFE